MLLTLQTARVITEHLLERERFRRIVERCRAAVGVDVLDISRRDVAVGERALHRSRGLRSVRPRGGHVMRVIRVSISYELGVDMGASGARALQFLEHEDGAALAHHEAIAVAVEGSRGSLRLVVARRHSTNDRERAKSEWRERRLGGAAEHDVRIAVANLTEAVTDRDRARRAAHRVGAIRSLEPNSMAMLQLAAPPNTMSASAGSSARSPFSMKTCICDSA